MTVRRALLGSFLALLSMVAATIVYLWALTPAEKWLLFWRSEAETYAQMTLAGKAPGEGPLYENFIDVYIETNQKANTVLFSPHDNHEITVVFAPGCSTEQFRYNDELRARRIRGCWYTLF
jgi:hypothetical protein